MTYFTIDTFGFKLGGFLGQRAVAFQALGSVVGSFTPNA